MWEWFCACYIQAKVSRTWTPQPPYQLQLTLSLFTSTKCYACFSSTCSHLFWSNLSSSDQTPAQIKQRTMASIEAASLASRSSMIMYCQPCKQKLNGEEAYESHLEGMRHKKYTRPPKKSSQSSKGIVIPKGTAIIIAQAALHADAVSHYMLRLYNRAAFRSRL